MVSRTTHLRWIFILDTLPLKSLILLRQPLRLHLEPLWDNRFSRPSNLPTSQLVLPTDLLDRLQLDEAVLARIGTVEVKRLLERHRRIGYDPRKASTVLGRAVQHQRMQQHHVTNLSRHFVERV